MVQAKCIIMKSGLCMDKLAHAMVNWATPFRVPLDNTKIVL